MLAAVGLDPESHLRDREIEPRHVPTVVVMERVLPHHRADARIVEAQLDELLEPGVGNPTHALEVGERTGEHPSARPTGDVEALDGVGDPAEARAAAYRIVQRPLDHERLDRRAEITQRPRPVGAPNPLDGDDVAPVEVAGAMHGDPGHPERPREEHRQLDLVEHLEPVNVVETRRGRVRRDGTGMTQHGAGDALEPRRSGRTGQQHQAAARHLEDEPVVDQATDLIAMDVLGSSLGTSEDVVLRGCELGHNAQGVDRHGEHPARGH